jgi:hypothetical protein
VHVNSRGNTHPLPPTLENYAAAKRLPVDFLESLGLATVHLQGGPAVKMPYFIDRSAVLRRVRVAIEDGCLVNLEEGWGRPARITRGDPLPEERAVLPHPDALVGETGGACAIPSIITARVH